MTSTFIPTGRRRGRPPKGGIPRENTVRAGWRRCLGRGAEHFFWSIDRTNNCLCSTCEEATHGVSGFYLQSADGGQKHRKPAHVSRNP